MTPVWPRRRRDDEACQQQAADTLPSARQEPEPPTHMNVGRGGIGAGRDVSHNALGENSQVIDNRQIHVHGVPREVSWPLEVGAVPRLATAFQRRAALRRQVDAARADGTTTVLTQVLSGAGGVGKSQLAASYADEALRDGTDLVLWVTAVEVQQVITHYAQAAKLVSAPGATGNSPEDDARAFLSWLATTTRRWLVVLDDVADPAGMGSWWPASRTGSGWVLATTRLRDARLTGGDRRRIGVDVYTPEEAVAYLRARLAKDGAEHLLDAAVGKLAAALGYLPLALGHAAAYMINEEMGCTPYLARFTDSSRRLDRLLPATADTEGYGRPVATTLLLSLDAAQRTKPTGLAEPALRLVALLDPAGHPKSLWTAPGVLDHIAEQRALPTDHLGEREPVTSEDAEAVLRVLHRYALITSDSRQGPRAVRIHALTARAVHEATPSELLPSLTATAADALMHNWPDLDQPHADLAATLRANTDHLAHHAGEHLWQPDAHPILYRAGQSLIDAGLIRAAVAYWERLTTESARTLGNEHPDALIAQGNLATSYWQAGRTNEATTLHEHVLSESERILGPEHPDTLTTRNALATNYRQAGRTNEAITLLQQVLADRERILGPQHPHTLTTRNNLATNYWQAGRTDEATTLQQQVLADRERVLGNDHPDTLNTRGNLAISYWQAGRTGEATTLLQQVLADRERILGPQHPDTLNTRNNLATWQAGQRL